MIKSRFLLLLIALASIGLLAVGLYLQHVKNMQPCPFCVMQRYAFMMVALICLICCIGNAPKLGAGFGMIAALVGGGLATYHLWIKAHPGLSCGIDPMETALNYLITAELLPEMFMADGLCSTDYPPVFGLSIPAWSLIWFSLFFLAMLFILLRREVKFV